MGLRCQCLTCQLNRWADVITAYNWLMEREKERQMAMELKGLKAKSLRSRQVIERLGKAYDKFNADGEAHAGDVESIAGDLGSMSQDLGFMTRELGNSVAASNGSGEVEEHHEQQEQKEAAEQPTQPPSKPSALPEVEFVEMHPSHQPGSPASSEPGH
jgi:hypothetical protein